MTAFLHFVAGERDVNTRDNPPPQSHPCRLYVRSCKKQQSGGVTWLDQSDVEDLLDEAVVGGDLIHGARRVLYTDDVHRH